VIFFLFPADFFAIPNGPLGGGGFLWGLLLMGEGEVSALEAEVVRLRAGIQSGKMGGRE